MEVSATNKSAVSRVSKTDTSKAVDNTNNSQSTTEATSTENQTNAASQVSSSAPNASDAFTEFMKKALGAGTKTQVSEEELFSALIENRLDNRKPEMAEAFRKFRDELTPGMRKADGFIPAEEIALRALQKISDAGVISKEEAEKVSGEAFAGAQLDSDATTLYDNRGGAGDITIAVAEIGEAIAKARSVVEGLEKEASKVSPRPIESSATGVAGGAGGGGVATTVGDSASGSSSGGISSSSPGEQKIDGNGGFLWKPVSESDGKLAVLLPEDFAGDIAKVEVYSKMPADSSSLVDSSRYGGSHEGRPIFRFHKTGAAMGDEVFLVVTKDDGKQAWWPISDGAKRID